MMKVEPASPQYFRNSSYSSCHDLFYEPDCPKKAKGPMLCVKQPSCSESNFDCSSIFHLQEAQDPSPSMSFKQAVVLVVAVEKLKKQVQTPIHFISDEDLYDLFLNIFEPEPIECETVELLDQPEKRYIYRNQTIEYSIRDVDKKCFLLQKPLGSPRLTAVHLQGPDAKKEVKINMAFYMCPGNPTQEAVVLGIAGENLYLCCTGESPPVLTLETVDKNVLGSMSSSELQPFIFFKSNSGSTCRFESATFPSWYISTSLAENERVKVSQLGQTAFTEFNTSRS
ncbi:interleukin-1 beta-like [Latimeria chalumnae]|uniref:interleukin-1 beta-like n=1 Tax=Latimeria chalumnae TaxID=7897 RepID=UPI00313B6F40